HVGMQETLWVFGLLLVAVAYAAVSSIAGDQIVLVGLDVMLSAAAIGIPLEALYFLLLALALHTNHRAPKGWYWRSFEHHGLLSTAQRMYILPFFYTGALAFLGIVIGISICILGFLALAFRNN
ncbi:MAG TPA: hypothetical protein VFN67_22780, partial [Polyangiales bacterium]|nr:hypothetical protein [Polyangiales bacterium]